MVCLDLDQPAGSVRPFERARGLIARVCEEEGLTHAENLEDDPPWNVLPTLVVDAVVWRSGEPPRPDLPKIGCLERVVATALADAYPDRMKALCGWLSVRPDPPAPAPEDHTWGFMSSWFAGHGCTAFLHEAIWQDAAIRNALEARLESVGILEKIRQLG